MEIRKSVSIVIYNYNGRDVLMEFLPYTYKAIENADTPYEIIIIDDCSTDDSIEFIQSAYSNFKLLVNTEKKGLCYSCNQGIAAAHYELTFLVSSDIKLAPDYFEHQWKYFMAWDTFGVMGRIVDMNGDHIQDAAKVAQFNGLKINIDYFYYTDNSNNRLLTFYLSGVNALINSAKLKQLGGFSEIFSPFYCEDMELGIRAWRLKWKCYYEHNAVCRRSEQLDTKYDEFENYVYFRNCFFLHAIHLSGLSKLLWYFQITFFDLVPGLINGNSWLLKSYKELFKNRPAIKGYKSEFEKLLNNNDSDVSIFDVVSKIRLSVKNKRLHKFNP